MRESADISAPTLVGVSEPVAVADPPHTSAPRDATPAASPWYVRATLRICAVYFLVYVLTTQMLTSLLVVPFGGVPNLGQLPPVTTIVEAIAFRMFGATLPLVITRSGSGDKTFDWVHAFTVLVLALVVGVVWAWRARPGSDVRLLQWSRLLTRFALGSTLITYGAVKAIPLQMPFPNLNRLLERYGDFSPMGVLWASIGASPAYESFTGSVELLAGILLFIPATATLGALTSLAATVQVFTLNMTYDVPVKLFSFHLVVMSLFLLAPEAKRLANVLLFNRVADVSPVPPLGRTVRARRAIAVLQIVLGVYLAGMGLSRSLTSWSTFGGGAPVSPLYGIWDIEKMTIDGVERAPLLTDYDRWRRVTFDRPTAMSFHRMDDTVLGYAVTIDEAARTITMTRPQDAQWKAVLSYERLAPDRLRVSGALDGPPLDMHLRLVDRGRFLLVSRGFRWVQEYPFNR
jgi:hypothetical protein